MRLLDGDRNAKSVAGGFGRMADARKCGATAKEDMNMTEELDQNALEHGSMMPAREAYELIEMDALARNIVHYAKNSVMPFEQVVQVTKERLEKAFREFSARPNPKPSNARADLPPR